jgi:hypothetical protein
MKNPAPYLRRTILALLDGNVSYDGAGVDVVESGSGGEGIGYQIFIGEYSDADSSNKHTFGANATQVIEVVAEQYDSLKKAVDAIGELVMNLIHPTTQSSLLSGTDFKVIVVGRPSINHLVEDSGSGTKIVRLLLRYNLLITHN